MIKSALDELEILGFMNQPLGPLTVQVTDADGKPCARLPVDFRVVKGKARFERRDASTDETGLASAIVVPLESGTMKVTCLEMGNQGGTVTFVADVGEAVAEPLPQLTPQEAVIKSAKVGYVTGVGQNETAEAATDAAAPIENVPTADEADREIEACLANIKEMEPVATEPPTDTVPAAASAEPDTDTNTDDEALAGIEKPRRRALKVAIILLVVLGFVGLMIYGLASRTTAGTAPAKASVIDCSRVTPKIVGQTFVYENCQRK